jgi:hypothetical protein
MSPAIMLTTRQITMSPVTFICFIMSVQECDNDDVVIPLAFHLYYDDFGVTSKKKCGGIYVSLANVDMHTMHDAAFR